VWNIHLNGISAENDLNIAQAFFFLAFKLIQLLATGHIVLQVSASFISSIEALVGC
jgi:hypothetical protein